MHPVGTCICFVRACPKHRMMRKPARPQYVRTRICVPAQVVKLSALDGLSTCVRTCVCVGWVATMVKLLSVSVCVHMCACNSIAHARRRCVRRPDDGAPMVVCPSSPVAWLPFDFLSAVRDAGVCTPIGGDAVVIVVRHAVFSVCFPFVRGVPGVRFAFSRAVRRVPGVFSTRRWTPVFAMVRGCFGVSGFAWVRVLV